MQIGPSGEFDFGPNPSMSDILASYTGSLPAAATGGTTATPTPAPANPFGLPPSVANTYLGPYSYDTPGELAKMSVFSQFAKDTGQTTGGSSAPSTTSQAATLSGNYNFPTGGGSGYGQKLGQDLLSFGGGGRSGQDNAPGLRGDNFGADFANANVAATPSLSSAARIAPSMSPTGLASDVIGLGLEAAGISNPLGSSPFDVSGPMLSSDQVAAVQKAMSDLPINAPLSDVMAAMNNALSSARTAATAAAAAPAGGGGGYHAQTGGPGPGLSAGVGAAGEGTNIGGAGVSHNLSGGGGAAQGGAGGGGQGGGIGGNGPGGSNQGEGPGGGQGANAGF